MAQELDDDLRIAASLQRLGERGRKTTPQKSTRDQSKHNARTLRGRTALEKASVAPDGRVKRRGSTRTAQLNVTIEEILKARLVNASRERDERIVDIVERALAAELDKLESKRA